MTGLGELPGYKESKYEDEILCKVPVECILIMRRRLSGCLKVRNISLKYFCCQNRSGSADLTDDGQMTQVDLQIIASITVNAPIINSVLGAMSGASNVKILKVFLAIPKKKG